MKPNRGGTILALGIISLVICMPLGIVAWVMGNNDLREMDQGIMDPCERQMTNAGRICGMVGTALFAVPLLMLILLFGGALLSQKRSPTSAFDRYLEQRH